MSRKTQMFVWSVIAAMALVTLSILVWRADAFANFGSLADHERFKLTGTAFGLVFLPGWLALGTVFMTWVYARAGLRMAEDQRRIGENSLIGGAIFMAGVYGFVVAGVVLGEPPGREFGGRVVEAIAGAFFIVNANFAAKTSPPLGWPDPGRWIRGTLRTGWVGVAAGLVILAAAIWAPIKSTSWIMAGATLAYAAAAVLNHVGSGRKSA